MAYHSQYTKRGKVFARKTELNNWSLIFPSETSREWRNLPLDQISFSHWAQEVWSFLSPFWGLW
jgi:hypothetical protein